MEILTGEQMRRADRHAIETLGIASVLLMESAGRGIAEAILRDHPEARQRGVAILCGKGNNGGDGLVVARHLARAGVRPQIVLLGRASDLGGDVAVNHRAAIASGLGVEEAFDGASWARTASTALRQAIVVDALLGTGTRGAARGLLAEVIEQVNSRAGTTLAVDLPSGIDADSIDVSGPAIRATRTYTLCRPKLPLVAGPASSYCGVWSVIAIGIPDASVAAAGPEMEWLEARDVRGALPARRPDSHKGTYGHLLALAGSRGKSGAAVLVARAALRTGVGLVTVASPASAQPEVAVQQAEVMTERLSETAAGTLSRDAIETVRALAVSKDALALGPGLGVVRETAEALRRIVIERSIPAVVDADALNAIAESGIAFLPELHGSNPPAVLTPHPGEAARLLGDEVRTIQADRIGAARRLAEQTGAWIALKGHRTVVAGPDGRVSLNSSGNSGMATAGAGDVLTGVIGALLARGLIARDAARVGVLAHGLAGDLVAASCGQEGMLAGDLVDRLPAAFGAIRDAPEDRSW